MGLSESRRIEDRDDQGFSGREDPPGLASVPGGPGLTARGPLVLALMGWVFLCVLHRPGDSLWFPNDPARHLANGIFFRDYAAAGFPSFTEFARGYLLRYPIINPLKYPPAFYVLEAATFAIVGPSLLAAESLVLSFALMAVLYQLAWLRRFVAPEAAYLAPLLLLLPAVAGLSHAIMLNVPALALQLASLYHVRRWLDESSRGQLALGVLLGTLALLTYQGNLAEILVVGWWVAIRGRWRSLARLGAFPLAIAAAAVLIGVAALLRLGHSQLRWLVDTPWLWYLDNWLYYLGTFPDNFGLIVPGLAAVGLVIGSGTPGWRREVAMSGSWIASYYLFHSYLDGKDPRYLMPIAPPLLSLAAISVLSGVRLARESLGPNAAKGLFAIVLATILGVHGVRAWRSSTATVSGFAPILEAIERQGPSANRSILLCTDQVHASLVTALFMTSDEIETRAMPASWLFRFAGIDSPDDLRSYGDTPREGMARILASSGCEWILVQEGCDPPDILPFDMLNKTLSGAGFTKLQRVTLDGSQPCVVNLYHQDGRVAGLGGLRRPKGHATTMDWLLRSSRKP